MTNLEIAEYLMSKIYSYESAKLFLSDLGIDIEIEGIGGDYFQRVECSYNGEEFHSNEYGFFDKIFIQKLLNILEPEKIEIVKQTVIEMQSRQPSKKSKTSSKKESPTTININAIANANAINENTISISTLSQLTTEVSQNTTLTNEVKTEIQDIISKLEDAKDNSDEDSYFDLFFKLLDKLQGSGLIPEWVTKSAKFARKFIDK